MPTWSFGGQIPGPGIRVPAGQILQALLVNRLPVETTVHWHGVAIRNDMDGVPGMTQAPVPAGQEFTYGFTVAEPGTYDFDAANPGQWMTHCHNLYHAPQGGMMAMLSYRT